MADSFSPVEPPRDVAPQNGYAHPKGDMGPTDGAHNSRHDAQPGAQIANGTPNGGPVSSTVHGVGEGPGITSSTAPREVLCGPLLNFKRLSEAETESPTWHGSVLLVMKPGDTPPKLNLSRAGSITSPNGSPEEANERSEDVIPRRDELADGIQAGTGNDNNTDSDSTTRTMTGIKLYSDPEKTFWRFDLALPLEANEAKWVYTIPNIFIPHDENRNECSRSFFVPSAKQSMRIMFHSCNGFSVGTDEDFWSGPALWNDVLRVHAKRPFHVMIGGGDQIYNDSVRVKGPLKEWTDIGNPRKRREFPFKEDLRARCDKYYFENYAEWYSTGAFATANAQIPQINIWDDHDIIDGFGSYTDRFMTSHVFRGLGGVAHKYYMLFQHHFPPPVSTFTSDAPQSTKSPGVNGAGADSAQLKDTFVRQEEHEDPGWIIGPRPGPYVQERSRSLYMRLGRRIAFVGLDARTERTRHQINYPETYDLVLKRVDAELSQSRGEIKQLIVLLGVPIAYPRLIWLENILTSPIIGPIRFLNKRFGVAGGFFNAFDGQVDLLDDLDDHYTARQHKKERKELLHRFQTLARQHSVRITILGGDVHLAALGRFYSNPKLNIPTRLDHRYMANVVSSAITNKPPPKPVANMLARRNKIHHLDHDTDETLLNLFDQDPGGVSKNAAANKCTMPSRNYAILTETLAAATNGVNGAGGIVHKGTGLDGHKPLHPGEEGCGTEHPAAAGVEVRNVSEPFGLDVSFRVEIDNADREGKTHGYGFHSE
ncbi:MAG: hypothetical protein M1833_006162 [Piccolia ochrophora]|nr:MAG: hypothetical protein M1833_006162 [Piccolia ochrophora]